MPQSSDVPVLFLVFNRPDLASRVFERIREARPTRLFIAADGPRADRPDDIQACRETRQIAELVDWPCSVKTLFRDVNMGCGRAVSSAISWFFQHVDSGIILEDDCLPHPCFFRYCGALLERYKDDHRVMSISGDCFFPEENISNQSYDFMAYVHIWGWATWSRAWHKFNRELCDDDISLETKWLNDWLGDRESADYWARIFKRYRDGFIDTWDYPWLHACWKNEGVSIVPAVNLVTNIGNDERATHGHVTSDTAGRDLRAIEFPLKHPTKIKRNQFLEAKTKCLYIPMRKQGRMSWLRGLKKKLEVKIKI